MGALLDAMLTPCLRMSAQVLSVLRIGKYLLMISLTWMNSALKVVERMSLS